MRKQALRTVTMLGLLMFLGVVSGQAQSLGQIEVTIPFNFTAGETRLSAGEYTVKSISDHAVLLRSTDGKMETIILAPRAISPGHKQETMRERVVFHHYQNDYFLSQVWILRTLGRDLNTSDAEKRARRESYLAKRQVKPDLVEVTAGTR